MPLLAGVMAVPVRIGGELWLPFHIRGARGTSFSVLGDGRPLAAQHEEGSLVNKPISCRIKYPIFSQALSCQRCTWGQQEGKLGI